MVTCTLCKQQHVPYITVNKLNICTSCAKEEGIYTEDLRTCDKCLCTTSKFHGNEQQDKFICSTCLHEEHNYAVDEFINDPAHKGVPIDNLFVEVKKSTIVVVLTMISYLLTVAISIIKPKPTK